MTYDIYTNHPLRVSINSLLALEEAPALHASNISSDPSMAYARDKTFAVAHLVHNLFENTPGALVSFTVLNNIQANIQSPLTEMTNFVANGNPGHLANAVLQIDQNVIPLLNAFPPLATEPKSFASLANKLLIGAKQGVKALQDQESDLEKRYAALVKTATEQQARLEALTEAVASQKADALAVTAQVNKLFAEEEQVRIGSFATTLQAVKEEAATFDNETRDRALKLIAELSQKRDDAAKIVQVVGNIGVTGNYQKIADNEKGSADTWRRVAVFVFAIGILFAGATFYKLYNLELTQETALSALIRLVFAIAITAPAYYAAKESARHRTTADRARQTELELASLGPFIELLDENKKSAIRESLIEKYFGNGRSDHEVSSPLPTLELKEVLIEAIKAIPKGRG